MDPLVLSPASNSCSKSELRSSAACGRRSRASEISAAACNTCSFLGSSSRIERYSSSAASCLLLCRYLSALSSRLEMSGMHPAARSFGVYAELYLNRWAGFVARYGYWFSVVIAVGAEVVAAGTYMRTWFPNVPVVFWMVIFGLFLVVTNLFSVGNYATFEYWFALIKVVTIFVFIVMGAALLFGGKVHAQYVGNGGVSAPGRLFPLIGRSPVRFRLLGSAYGGHC